MEDKDPKTINPEDVGHLDLTSFQREHLEGILSVCGMDPVTFENHNVGDTFRTLSELRTAVMTALDSLRSIINGDLILD